MSHLDYFQLAAVLNRTGLAEYFPLERRVSASNNYPGDRAQYLGAALRIEQRPDRCVVFDNTPSSANEAHEVGMKSVSFVNHYPKYELISADLSVGSAWDLDLRNVMKIFVERSDTEPLLEIDVSSTLGKKKRSVKTA